MIKIQFISSPDPELDCEITYYSNQLTLGRQKQNDIVIFDSNLYSKHLEIKIEQNVAMVQTLSSEAHAHIDGKKFVGVRQLKIGQELKIGNTKLKLVEFTAENFVNNDESFEKNYLKAIKHSTVKNVLERIEKEILLIEQDLNV